MTLARYQGTGLAEVAARPGLPSAPRWWRHLAGSRYCPRCLAVNGGRWMLAWRIPWAFACTGCQVLLADACPDCGATPSAALLSARGRPAEAAALRQYLDDACAVARASISAAGRTGGFPAAVTAVLDELGARTGPGSAFASPPRSAPRQLAPVTAFGVAVADLMLHGRSGDPDPVIAGWLAGHAASRGQMTCPGQVPIVWNRASPALQASLAGPLAAQAGAGRCGCCLPGAATSSAPGPCSRSCSPSR